MLNNRTFEPPTWPSVEECLRNIDLRETSVRAWVEVAPRFSRAAGTLAGVAVGVKDIFEVAGQLCEYGSPLMAGQRGKADAALVRLLAERGAVLLGKTHTAAFAYFDPPPTRNPRNLGHTPGGSSSGSAAAVAAGMAAVAVGSQTQGSVIRPASYCGVVGFKPSFGLLSLDGCLPFAPSLDTAGFFTATASQMRWFWRALGFSTAAVRVPRMAAFACPEGTDPAMREAFEAEVARVGAPWVTTPEAFQRLAGAVRLIQDYEGARTHRGLYERHGRGVGEKFAAMIDRGLSMPAGEYEQALAQLAQARAAMEELWAEWDVVLTPAAPGPAPEGLGSTGDPRMNAGWTGLGSPAITVPMAVTGGLPLGLQLAARPGADAILLEAACIVEK